MGGKQRLARGVSENILVSFGCATKGLPFSLQPPASKVSDKRAKNRSTCHLNSALHFPPPFEIECCSSNQDHCHGPRYPCREHHRCPRLMWLRASATGVRDVVMEADHRSMMQARLNIRNGWKADVQSAGVAAPNTRRCQYILRSRNHALLEPEPNCANWRMLIL